MKTTLNRFSPGYLHWQRCLTIAGTALLLQLNVAHADSKAYAEVKSPPTYMAAVKAAQALLPANASPLQQQVYQTVLDYVTQQTLGYPGQVKVEIQPLDARVRLTPCEQLMGYTLQGSKLWGKTHVGVKCAAGAGKPWSIYVQTDVQVWGEYAVTALPVSQGTRLQPELVVMQYGDLSKLPAGVITDATQLNGKQAALNLPLGSVLRPEVLKALPVIMQGQTVQIISQGEGFVVTSEGVAANTASSGQLVDVKVRSGQVIKGYATANGRIEMRF